MIPRFDYHFTMSDLLWILKFHDDKSHLEIHKLEDYFNGNTVCFVSKARIGIRIALQALDLKAGAGIGVQPFTCSSVLYAIKRAGFKPVFIDIDDDLHLLKEDIRLKNDQLNAIILTHTFGYPADFNAVKEVVGEKPVIEDCAQALFSVHQNKPVGLAGSAGVFSLGYGKLFGTESGGFIITSDSRIWNEISIILERLPPCSGWDTYKSTLRKGILGILSRPLIYDLLTYPLKKQLASVKNGVQKYPAVDHSFSWSDAGYFMSKFDIFLQRHLEQYENGKFLLSLIDERFHPPRVINGNRPNFFLIPLLSPERDMIIHHLQKKGIESSKHFSNSIRWVYDFGYQKGSCGNFERITREIFTLPCHYYLTEKDLRFMADTLNSFQ